MVNVIIFNIRISPTFCEQYICLHFLYEWISILARYNKLGMVQCNYVACKIVFYSLHVKIVFVIANRVDPDEMPHYVAFHMALHYLPK